ncbi:MAG TPA: DUF4173 domain-containing protein [Planctomycetota bacterium]|nr:DUF4173 domain-containing protein [Planctomycetota bacterium]
MDALPEKKNSPATPETNPPAPIPGPEQPAAAIPAEPSKPKNQWIEALIPQISPLILMGVLLLIILFDYFIYQGASRTGGLGLGTLFLLAGLLIWLIERPSLTRGVLICGALLILFALRTIWQAIFFTEVIAFLLIFIFTCSTKKFPLHIPELIHSFLWTWLKLPMVLIGFAKTLINLVVKSRLFSFKIFRLGLAWLIPAAIVLVFIIIFALGNLVVGSWIHDALTALWDKIAHIFDYLPSIGHIFFWIFSFVLAVILLLPQKMPFTIFTPLFGEAETMSKPSLTLPLVDFRATVALNTLIAVNLLFLVYNGIDIYYLWIQKTLPAGLSYSVYARSGTFWLTLALALTSLVLGIIFIRDLNFHRRTSVLKTLAWVWVAQNLILALGTFQRLLIYVNYNGLTRMRIVGAYGICLVVIGLLIVAFKMQGVRSFLWMVRRHILAFGLALFVLSMTPMDLLVGRYNTHIILNDNYRPAIQLIVQPITAEGITALIPLLDCKDQTISAGVAGILLREQEKLQQLKDKEQRWADKELSRSRALNAIKSVQPKLKAIIPDNRWKDAIDELDDYTQKWY